MERNNGEQIFLHYNGKKMEKTVKTSDISPLLEWRKEMEKTINNGEKLLMKMEKKLV